MLTYKYINLNNCLFFSITKLDLSMSRKKVETIDDTAAIHFFDLIGANLKSLHTLIIDCWKLNLKDLNKVGQKIKTCGTLKHLSLADVNERRMENFPDGFSIGSNNCSNTFLHQLVFNLPKLKELCLYWYKIDDYPLDTTSARQLGTCFHNHWEKDSFNIKIRNNSVSVETALKSAFTETGHRKPPCTVNTLVLNSGCLMLRIRRRFFK